MAEGLSYTTLAPRSSVPPAHDVLNLDPAPRKEVTTKPDKEAIAPPVKTAATLLEISRLLSGAKSDTQ